MQLAAIHDALDQLSASAGTLVVQLDQHLGPVVGEQQSHWL
jgi:hypothetical protein